MLSSPPRKTNFAWNCARTRQKTAESTALWGSELNSVPMHVCGSLPTTKKLTNLFPTNTIGIADVSWRSWIILLLRSLSSCQLDTELMANNTRNASPVATDESRNELYSSCPAVSTISTSYNLPLYSIYEKRRRCFHKIIITSLHHLRSSVVTPILSIIVCFQI